MKGHTDSHIDLTPSEILSYQHSSEMQAGPSAALPRPSDGLGPLIPQIGWVVYGVGARAISGVVF